LIAWAIILGKNANYEAHNFVIPSILLSLPLLDSKYSPRHSVLEHFIFWYGERQNYETIKATRKTGI
jgi:hypothetical protein